MDDHILFDFNYKPTNYNFFKVFLIILIFVATISLILLNTKESIIDTNVKSSCDYWEKGQLIFAKSNKEGKLLNCKSDSNITKLDILWIDGINESKYWYQIDLDKSIKQSKFYKLVKD